MMMASQSELMHQWMPHMKDMYICGKCGETASCWDEVEDISRGPCVHDDDPVVAKVQTLINTEIASMWRQMREQPTRRAKDQTDRFETMARRLEASVPGECEESPTIYTPPTQEEKERFAKWLNDPDPVMNLSWFEVGGDRGR